MNLMTLSDSILLVEAHMATARSILRESSDGLTLEQRHIVEGIYNEFVPLIEATLTAQQIQQVFTDVEQAAAASGNNRTGLGMGVDTAKKANEIVNNVGKWLQDTKPVQAFDQKFESLKGKVAAKFPNLATKVEGLGQWVEQNPGKSAAVIGVLTALASLAAGPVGGAVAGQVLRGTQELLKGEKLSTAVGKGIKTAALGYISGKAFEIIGDWVADMRAESIPFGPKDAGLSQVNYGATRELTAPGFSQKETLQGFNVVVLPDEEYAIKTAMQMIDRGEPAGFDMLSKVAQEIESPLYREIIGDILKGSRAQQLDNDSLMQWIKGLSKAAQSIGQGAVAGISANAKKESTYIQQRPLSEGQVYLLFNQIQQLDEANFLSRAAGAVAQKVSQVGSNLTNIVTADKLNKAWKKAGSPTDSAELEQFLTSQGVSPDIVASVFDAMRLPTAAAAETPSARLSYKEIKDMVMKLDKKGRQRIAAYLQKQLGTA